MRDRKDKEKGKRKEKQNEPFLLLTWVESGTCSDMTVVEQISQLIRRNLRKARELTVSEKKEENAVFPTRGDAYTRLLIFNVGT